MYDKYLHPYPALCSSSSLSKSSEWCNIRARAKHVHCRTALLLLLLFLNYDAWSPPHGWRGSNRPGSQCTGIGPLKKLENDVILAKQNTPAELSHALFNVVYRFSSRDRRNTALRNSCGMFTLTIFFFFFFYGAWSPTRSRTRFTGSNSPRSRMQAQSQVIQTIFKKLPF